MFVYALIDPRDGQIRYVGKTKQSIQRRLSVHILNSKKHDSHKDRWIRSLGGLRPVAVVLCECSEAEVNDLERGFIAVLTEARYDLTNTAPGGEGGWSDAARAAIPRGPRPPSFGAAVSAGKLASGYKHSEETKRKIREARARQVMSPCSEEKKAKISRALHNHPVSEETRRKQSDAALARRAEIRGERTWMVSGPSGPGPSGRPAGLPAQRRR